MAQQILRLPAVIQKTGLSRSSIYAKLSQSDDDFPRPIKLGVRTIGWTSSSIDEWIEELIRTSSQ